MSPNPTGGDINISEIAFKMLKLWTFPEGISACTAQGLTPFLTFVERVWQNVLFPFYLFELERLQNCYLYVALAFPFQMII